MTYKLKIRELRLSLGLSQSALADKSGVPQTTISAIESGTNLTYETAKKLAKALGVSTDDLSVEVAK
ncbi:transcriptional regulator [Latilactobacillus curvatus]|uniref:Transcriptional regulator n=1 Tax=Latilactobacillus curvatus TaxID=28038 RepID=A0AAC9UQG3_LATCU|nr:helix-turn-helix transcriptional regulator [Latilactobacillus curvatus]ASN59797.1 transcriptional regulator [Latilactobacillus curvatus]